MAEKIVKVFISYSWDSEDHKNKVLLLAESLRKYGIDCQIDRYHPSPPEGWYRWMMNRVEESDFVLVVCTEKYNLRYRNKEKQGQGQGVTWEGGLIISELYNQQGINKKFIPILLSAEGENYIPQSLHSYTVYRLFSSEDYDVNKPGDYQNLYRHLTNQPAYIPAQLGQPQRLLPINKAPSTVSDHGEIIQAKDPEQAVEIEIFNDLSSDRNVDYTQLQDLLKARDWRAADLETARRMCEVMGQQNKGYLRVEDVQQFPCADLRTIDRLWVKYSKNKFGFSVQKQIWQECDSPLEYTANWEKFGDRVGYRVEGRWISYGDVVYEISAPGGHLPWRVLWSPPAIRRDYLSVLCRLLSLFWRTDL